MAEVRWASQAVAELEAIAGLIAESSPHYASLFVMDVLAAVERIADLPHSGRVIPETRDVHFARVFSETIESFTGREAISSRSSPHTTEPGCSIRRGFDASSVFSAAVCGAGRWGFGQGQRQAVPMRPCERRWVSA